MTRMALRKDTDFIARRILLIRGTKVMIDADLAELYGVPTKALDQAVKRNVERFPDDFMFRLMEGERQEVVTNCDHLVRLKFSPSLPFAFTEHGALMLGNVLKSPRAVEVSLLVVRAFVQLREMLATHKELAAKLDELERKVPRLPNRVECIQCRSGTTLGTRPGVQPAVRLSGGHALFRLARSDRRRQDLDRSKPWIDRSLR